MSSTPRITNGKSPNGWRHTSSTGISPPAGSLSAAPICCDGFITLDLMAGQEYHCPHCLSWPRRVPPGGPKSPGLAPYLKASRRADRIGVVLLLALQVSHGAGIKVARSNGNVLGEWVFSFQGAAHSPQKQRTGGRPFGLPPVSPLKGQN